MARNRVEFQKGYSLVQFMGEYGTEDKYREALFRRRWPNGFVCPRCGHAGQGLVRSRWPDRAEQAFVDWNRVRRSVRADTFLAGMLAFRNMRIRGAA